MFHHSTEEKVMVYKRSIFCFFYLLSSAVLLTEKVDGIEERGAKQLFVFGDSYADTGNSPPSFSTAWRTPYGITFPGKPSGRFSDGRVLTDYIASYLGISSPTAYQLMKNPNPNGKATRNGMNFAHGGTGVFTTLVDQPNMTTQIDFFQQLIRKNVYTTLDLSSSIALVSLAGNDYAAYLAKNGTFQGLPEFTRSVVNQLILNVRRIKSFGIKKIAVTGIGPLGCLPANTVDGNCNALQNNFSESHNQMLKEHIWALNSEAAAPISIYLDLYTAFTSALQIHQTPPGNLVRKVKPCCMGECGVVDKNGKKKYAVCENPNHSFFWDSIHPSNSGWASVYSALNLSLYSLLI